MKPSEDFLHKYLDDVRDEMKWRRELEFRLLQFLLVFYPLIKLFNACTNTSTFFSKLISSETML